MPAKCALQQDNIVVRIMHSHIAGSIGARDFQSFSSSTVWCPLLLLARANLDWDKIRTEAAPNPRPQQAWQRSEINSLALASLLHQHLAGLVGNSANAEHTVSVV
jgi:hypothetical protein